MTVKVDYSVRIVLIFTFADVYNPLTVSLCLCNS